MCPFAKYAGFYSLASDRCDSFFLRLREGENGRYGLRKKINKIREKRVREKFYKKIDEGGYTKEKEVKLVGIEKSLTQAERMIILLYYKNHERKIGFYIYLLYIFSISEILSDNVEVLYS